MQKSKCNNLGILILEVDTLLNNCNQKNKYYHVTRKKKNCCSNDWLTNNCFHDRKFLKSDWISFVEE